MACSPAQLESNRKNALQSTGPKTEAGKEASRRNGLKHGLTGEGIVLSDPDAAAVKELALKLRAEMKPTSELSAILVDRMARLSVRMKKCQALDSVIFLEEEAEDGSTQVVFNNAPEAMLAWKYELSAERGFFKAWKEFNAHQERTADETPIQVAPYGQLGSSLPEPRPVAPAPKPEPIAAAPAFHQPLPPLNHDRLDITRFPRVPFLNPDLGDSLAISAGKPDPDAS